MQRQLLKKGTKTYSILKLKCPKCHEGNLFIHKNPCHVKRCLLMDDNCIICAQDFVIEPGFYYGALWMSYPVVVLIVIAITSIFLLVFRLLFNSFYVDFVIGDVYYSTLHHTFRTRNVDQYFCKIRSKNRGEVKVKMDLISTPIKSCKEQYVVFKRCV